MQKSNDGTPKHENLVFLICFLMGAAGVALRIGPFLERFGGGQ